MIMERKRELARLSLFALHSWNILHTGVYNYLKILGHILCTSLESSKTVCSEDLPPLHDIFI